MTVTAADSVMLYSSMFAPVVVDLKNVVPVYTVITYAVYELEKRVVTYIIIF